MMSDAAEGAANASAMSDAQRRSWALLMRAAEPPSLALAHLVAEIGVVAAAEAVVARQVPRGHDAALLATRARLDDRARARKILDEAARDLDRAERIGARLITPEDDEWPGCSLLSTTQGDTSDRGGAPLALWARGPLRVDDIAAASIAMVGSRACSSYGSNVTTTISEDLVSQGWGITSGAAVGIDGVAHRAALASDGSTMAVLACGIDRPYPAIHARLLYDIAERGVLLSEYPFGVSVGRHRFLGRNRLIAALSHAVVVAEAGGRSGAIATAGWAVKYGRPLGVLPTDVVNG